MHTNGVYNFIGLMSPRLWFNIWAVVVWVLIRKFLEIFGIYFDLAVKEESTPFGGYGKVAKEENLSYEQEKAESGFLSVGDEEKEKVDEVASESSERAEEATWVPVKESRLVMASGSVDGWQRIY